MGIDRERFGPDPTEADDQLEFDRDLPDRFVVYPANLWPHKNHRRLVEALSQALDGELALDAEVASDAVDLGGVSVRLVHVRGEASDRRVDCLGTLAETESAPRWDELDALRTVSVIIDERHALLALARRPRGARGHGEERVGAVLLDEGRFLEVDQARLSTVYDGDGRQRSAGLELWLHGEEYPRRGSGVVVAGSSLQLEEVEVHAAVFRWRLEGHDGIGGYELMSRTEPPAAA